MVAIADFDDGVHTRLCKPRSSELRWPLTALVVLPCSQSAMPQKVRILLLALVVLLGLVTLTGLLFLVSRAPPLPPLPNPNGYDDFLSAAAALTGDVANAPSLDHDGLRALMSTNAESLRLLRLGLTRACSVPTDAAITNISGLLNDLASLKSLARLLEEEGRLAEMEHRYGDAARSYVDAIRFGNETSRGAFIINRLVGIACGAVGGGPLSKLAPKLNREEAGWVVSELQKIDAARVSWAEVRRNEDRFSQYQLRKAFNPLAWVVTRWQRQRSINLAEMRHKRVIAHERLLAVELALRCYRYEKAAAPARLDDLVTNYLSHVPLDPFGVKPLTYRPQGTNWLLYSVGSDGKDDGGRPAGRGLPAKGDILSDSSW